MHEDALDERQHLRTVGRRAAAQLPEVSAETYRRIAELLREPVNQFIRARRGGDPSVA